MWYSQAPDGRGRKGVGQFPNFRLLLKYFPSFSNSPLPHVIGNPPPFLRRRPFMETG